MYHPASFIKYFIVLGLYFCATTSAYAVEITVPQGYTLHLSPGTGNGNGSPAIEALPKTNQTSPNYHYGTTIVPPTSQKKCDASTLMLCGQSYDIPSIALGSSFSFLGQAQGLTAHCQIVNGGPDFVLSGSAITPCKN